MKNLNNPRELLLSTHKGNIILLNSGPVVVQFGGLGWPGRGILTRRMPVSLMAVQGESVRQRSCKHVRWPVGRREFRDTGNSWSVLFLGETEESRDAFSTEAALPSFMKQPRDSEMKKDEGGRFLNTTCKCILCVPGEFLIQYMEELSGR